MDAQRRETAPVEKRNFRIDVEVHDVLTKPPARRGLELRGEPRKLPEPVLPQRPELAGDIELPKSVWPVDPANPYSRRWSAPLIWRAMRGWLFPYLKSRVLPGDFHPIIAYLFTEWKCNLDCHSCRAFDNRVRGMNEDTAKRAIDWLHSSGCRVLALMGGEVLLRPKFVHKVCYYAAKQGFWIYVPTNGRLLRPDLTDRLGDAGVAVFNLAVDSVEERKELPKALKPIWPSFEYLVKKQHAYGYAVFFNINITRINLEDVRRLTEIAHGYGIATDYHINESPMLEQQHFKHASGNATFLASEDWPKADELIDWLIEKNLSGLQDGQLRLPAQRNEDVHARQGAGLGLPSRPQFDHHPDRRNPGALLPPVFGDLRLGSNRAAPFRPGATGLDEEGLPTPLLLDTQPQPGLLLRCAARSPPGAQAGPARLPGNQRELRSLRKSGAGGDL